MSNYNTALHHALPVVGKKHNRYCGPAALAAITGTDTGSAAAILRQVTGKASIKGTSKEAMQDALEICGYHIRQTDEYYPHCSMTLRNFLRDIYDGELVLLEAMSHWFALHGECFVDSWNRLPTPIEDIHNPKSQVHQVHFLY